MCYEERLKAWGVILVRILQRDEPIIKRFILRNWPMQLWRLTNPEIDLSHLQHRLVYNSPNPYWPPEPHFSPMPASPWQQTRKEGGRCRGKSTEQGFRRFHIAHGNDLEQCLFRLHCNTRALTARAPYASFSFLILVGSKSLRGL